jgi:hypothetical protein
MSPDMNDDQLMEILGTALDATDPVPEHVVAAAKEILSPTGFDTELAQLVFDSANETLVGVRSAATARQVTFRAPGVEIEILMMAEGNRRMIGQLVPPQAATVELHFDDRLRETGTDTLGRFEFADVPVGSVQLVVTTADGGKIVTEWMVV